MATAPPTLARRFRRVLGMSSLALLSAGAIASNAQAAGVGLGTDGAFSVLGGSTVTNTGPSVLNGDLGLAPGSAVTGFPPGVINGAKHINDGVALQAKKDLVTAYNDAAGRSSTGAVSADLAGLTLTKGVYTASTSMGLSGNLTLDAQGDPNAVFVFQAGTTLKTASGSRVSLIGGAQACNVYWQVGSSATIGTATDFIGNILAMQSITLTTAARIQGRALARNGAVTLDTNTITRSTCAAGTAGGGTGTTTGGGSTTGGNTGAGGTTTGGGTTGGGTNGSSMNGTTRTPTSTRKHPTTKKHRKHTKKRRSPARPPRSHGGFTG